MTTPRSRIVNPAVSRWYHCITRCVRQAFLLGQGCNRKKWLEDRLGEVTKIFAVSVGSFAILDNHFHFLLRLDPAVAESWSAEEVVVRWATLHPPRLKRKAIAITPEWVAEEVKNVKRVEMLRSRLGSLSWFMKEVKEPLARLANKQDNCKGAFFEGRFKSIVLLDEDSLLTVSAYIDLNAVAAGVTDTLESAPFTSLNHRVANVCRTGRQADLATALLGSIAACEVSCGLEDDLWLIPIEDRRQSGGSNAEGMIEGFSLGSYLVLVEYTGRLQREGKAAVPPEVASVFERVGTTETQWQARTQSLSSGAFVGRFFSRTREALRRASNQLGLHHCLNLNGCHVG